MQPVNIIQNQQSQAFQPQTGKLQTGQIIHGKINKIYPNQTAEVQIGSQKIIASLDAPLQTGERYWLQVQPGEGRLHLKVLNGAGMSVNNGLIGVAEQLLAHLTVPQNRETTTLAKFLLKNQLPITKETFDTSLEWMKQSENVQGSLGSIKTMHTMNLPFVDDVFHALQSLESDESLYSSIMKLLGQISGKGIGTEVLQSVNSLLEKMAAPKQFQMASAVVDKLLVNWLSPDTASETQKSAFTILQKAGFIPLNRGEAQFIEKLFLASQYEKNKLPALLKVGLSLIIQYTVAKQTGSPEAEKLLEVFKQLVSNSGNKTAESFQPLMAIQEGERKGKIQNGITYVLRDPEAGKLTKKLIQTLLFSDAQNGDTDRNSIHADRLFSTVHSNRNTLEQAGNRLAGLIAGEMVTDRQSSTLNGSERQLLKEIIATGDKPVDFTKGPSIAGFVKEMSKMLGTNIEHFIANAGGGESGASSEEFVTLKPLLMKLLAENQHPSIKVTAEQILNRITAQQILSQETGPLQNIFMQIPLPFSHVQTDLTIQWSGRKKSDGTIDPNYCRVLFYLELERMNQTVIDVQIQNRVMKISVINDNHELLEQLSQPLVPVLKNNIENMNYRLSSVVFEREASRNEKQTGRTSSQIQGATSVSKPYSGVDIRI